MLARAKAKKAEETSDLNSDSDVTKRKKRKVVFSSSDEDEPISYLENRLPTPPRRKKAYSEQPKTPCDNESYNSDNILSVSVPPSESFSKKDTPTSTSNKCTNSCICCTRNNKELKRTLFIVKSISCEILEKVDRIIERNAASSSDNDEISLLSQVGIEYPILSVDVLKTFDDFFQDEKKYMSLVKYFAKIGGSNCSEYVKRCLAPIISDQLAEKFSFIGRKQKKNFSILNVARAVLDGADKMDGSRKDFEGAISAWLKRAKARLERQAR